MTDPKQCAAIAMKTGKRCRNNAMPGHDLCRVHARGGFYKFDELKKDAYLDALREGCGRDQAAGRAGVTRQTVANHRNRDPKFAQEESLAEIEAAAEVENALYMAAVSGNVTAIQVWLYNRLPERWADRRRSHVELTGKDGGPVEIDSPRDEIARRIAGLAERLTEGEDTE